ncbi:MAG: Ig-like domain-containing protein [Rikenellaceae bacterium]
MKLRLKYGMCCLAMVALLGFSTTSCIEAEKDIPDLEYAYTPATMTVTCESMMEYAYANGSINAYPVVSGGTVVLKALMTPYNVTFPEIIWLSSDETIATVSYPEDNLATVQGTDGVTNNGTVTAVGSVGESTNITARPPMEVSGLTTVQIPVTVRIVSSLTRTTSITLNSEAETLSVGDTFVATATASAGAIYGNEVLWSTSDASVATVSGGTITAKAAGSATISASSLDGSLTGSSVSGSIVITVEAAE